MAKFKVKVRIVAEVEYDVEVEVGESDYALADNAAIGMWREKTPSDFQVDKGYVTKWLAESEQLTADCPDCGKEHSVEPSSGEAWREDQDYCAACGKLIEEREAANG